MKAASVDEKERTQVGGLKKVTRRPIIMINKVFLAKFQESFPSSEFTVTSQSSGAYAVVINA